MAHAKVRPATLEDLEVLVRHRRLMWQDIASHTVAQLDAADAVYRRWARQRLKSGRLVGWVVEVGTQAVASGCVWVQDGQPRPGWGARRHAYLLSVYTDPAHRRRGHATRITKRALAWAAAQGLGRMTLHASHQGMGVYARLGFERTHEMRKSLGRPPVPRKGRRTNLR